MENATPPWPRTGLSYVPAGYATSILSRTDLTLSNIAGPGRNLDRTLNRAGRLLEPLFTRVMEGLGYTPYVVVSKLAAFAQVDHRTRNVECTFQIMPEMARLRADPYIAAQAIIDHRYSDCPTCGKPIVFILDATSAEIDKLVVRLLKWMRPADSTVNQRLVTLYISALASAHPLNMKYLNNKGASDVIEQCISTAHTNYDPEWEQLVQECRLALQILRGITTLQDLPYNMTLIQSLGAKTLSARWAVDDDTCLQFRRLVGSVIVLKNPMRCTDISRLLGTDSCADKCLIQLLHAVFLCTEDQPIRILDPSFPEYLLAARRCTDERLRINGPQQHRYLAFRCLCIMNQHLKPIVSHVYKIGTLNSEIPGLEERLSRATTPELQYACKNWIAHLGLASLESGYDDDITAFTIELYKFLSGNALLWIEIISLMGALDSSFTGYNEAASWMEQLGEHEELYLTFRELYIAVGRFHALLEESALEACNSLLVWLPFCMLSSQVTLKAKAWFNPTLIHPHGSHTGPLRACKGHTKCVTSIAFSPDGTRIVSGSDDRTLRIWDATTGAIQATLNEHTGWVTSVAFSSDSTRIVSGSDDSTVRIWDATAGTIQATLNGYTDWVRFVDFSPDGTHIVSASDDSIVQIWDATTGALRATLDGHTGWVTSAAFSPDSTRIVSGSDDGTARIWDATTGALQATLAGHTDQVTSVAFSTGGTQVILKDENHNSKTWDLQESIPGFQTSTFRATTQSTPLPIFSCRDGWLVAQSTSNAIAARLCWIPEDCRPTFTEGPMEWNRCIVAWGSRFGLVTILDCFQAVESVLAGDGKTLIQP